MIYKKIILKIELYIAILCFPFIGNSQNLTGVWEGKYTFQNTTYKFELHISYDNNLKLYVGQSRTKRTSYNSQNLFPQAVQTVILAETHGDSLIVSEIAAIAPKDNYPPYGGSKPQSDYWKFMGCKLIYSKQSEEEFLTGIWHHRKNFNGEIQFKKTKNQISNQYKSDALESLHSILLSDVYFISNGVKNILKENSSGELKYTIRNTGKHIFKDISTHLVFEKNNIGIKVPYLDIVQLGGLGGATYEDGVKKEGGFIFNSDRNISHDSIRGEVRMQTLFGIVMARLPFAIATEKLIKTNETTTIDWNNNRLKLIASYYGINNYRWNIKNDLEKLVAAGDKKALMWKTLFVYLGQAGYETDEQMAFSYGSEKRLFNYLVEQLKSGDVESMFLASVALMMNLAGSHYQEDYEYLLRSAAERNFPPAQYTLAVKRLYEKKYNDSKYYFQKALDSGVKIAGIQLGMFEESGWKIPKNVSNAMNYYDKVALLNNPEALLKLAAIYSTGDGVAKDNNEALKYLIRANKTGSSSAKLALADFYLKNKTNKSEIFPLTKQAADSENRDALFQMALLYTYPEMCGIAKDQVKAIEYLKNAAELGEPHAMNFLGLYYFNGVGLEKDYFLGRFWLSEAATRGVGEGVSDTVSFGQPLMAFLQGVCSYVPDIIVETRYYSDGSSHTNSYDDPNPIPYLAEGLISLAKEVHQQRQPTIDDFRTIYKRGNISTHGGILTTGVYIKLKNNDIVNVYASGKISLGFGDRLQNIEPDGMYSTGEYRYYSLVQTLPHGCVMATGDLAKSWGVIGKSATGIQIASNQLSIAVNDGDYKNNQGYFNIRVDIIRSDSTDKNETSSHEQIAPPVGNAANEEIKDKSKTPDIDISSIKYKRPENADLTKGHLVSIKNNWKGTFLGLNNFQAVCDSVQYQWLKINLVNTNCFYLIDPVTGLYLSTKNKKGELILTELANAKSIWQEKETNYQYRIRNINIDGYLNIENGPIACGKLPNTWNSAIWSYVYKNLKK